MAKYSWFTHFHPFSNGGIPSFLLYVALHIPGGLTFTSRCQVLRVLRQQAWDRHVKELHIEQTSVEVLVRPRHKMAMDQYLYIPFLVGWTSIYQLFWCSLGTRVLTHPQIDHVEWPRKSCGAANFDDENEALETKAAQNGGVQTDKSLDLVDLKMPNMFFNKMPGWWFQPLWKILVNGKDYLIYYGK